MSILDFVSTFCSASIPVSYTHLDVYKRQQEKTIEVTGVVTDMNKEPLVGVNVTVKDKPGLGAITDIDVYKRQTLSSSPI